MADRVGFIGLGIMGKSMARNLLRAGYPLVVHNRTAAKAEELAGEGAVAVGSPREVAEKSDVVITMLPDSPDVELVVEGPRGLLETIRRGSLVVDMSSISPVVTRRLAGRLAEKGASMVDAPVSGGDIGAAQGTLTIMAGGSAGDFERAKPIFEAMGKNIFHVGESGAGQVTKAANQVLVGITMAGIAEALVLGSRGGVSPQAILDVLGSGLAGNRIMEFKRAKYLTHVFEPGFRAELHAKDLGIALAAARESGVAMPVSALVEELFQEMKRKGWGGEDHSGLLKVIEDLSNHRIG